jgi:hypothetical protein
LYQVLFVFNPKNIYHEYLRQSDGIFFNKPDFLLSNEDFYFITNHFGNTLLVLNKNLKTKKILDFESIGKLNRPTTMYQKKDEIYLVDSHNKRIIIFHYETYEIKQVITWPLLDEFIPFCVCEVNGDLLVAGEPYVISMDLADPNRFVKLMSGVEIHSIQKIGSNKRLLADRKLGEVYIVSDQS